MKYRIGSMLLTCTILLVLIGPIQVNAQQAKPVIRNWPWKDKKKLSWKDFKKVDICLTPMPDGEVEWAMVNTYRSTTQEYGGKIHVSTILSLDDTWICSNVVRDDTLLMYLQVSYDLAELYTRKLNEIYRQVSVKGMSQQEIGEFMYTNQQKIEQEFSDRRTQFFDEARHGLNVNAIVRWKQQIDKELKELKPIDD